MIKKLGLLVLSVVILISCSSDDSSDSNATEVSIATSDYLYYITGKINGEQFVYGQEAEATVLDYSQAGYGNSITTDCAYYPDTGGLNYAMGVYPNLNNESQPNMYFDFIRFYLCGGDGAGATFNDSFPIGVYPTAISSSVVTGTTGAVSLHYQPNSTESMELYNSLTENQNGNSFEITSSTDANQYLGTQVLTRSQLLEGTFSFTLYNTVDASDTVEVTEGHFK